MKDSTQKQLATVGKTVDDRFGAANFFRRNMQKVFPDHWSFMLGEIALYSFVILILTGIYLTFFFRPSMQETIYHGSFVPLDGVPMSEAYASTLHLSFDIRGGLLMRQIHHWAALLFVAAIMVHMFRIFFTGAFRKPREINYLIGVTLFVLAMLEGFAGYSLPDDLLSGTGLRIFVSVVFFAIPVIGTYLFYFAWGGPFPDGLHGELIPRLYVLHILLVPAILLALITAHMLILWHQKHTQFALPRRTNTNVVGSPFFPVFIAKTGAFFIFIFAILALLGGFAQINPVWLYGPYNPVNVSAGSQPDWYIGILEGALRMMPGAETYLWGHTIVWSTLVPAIIVPGLLFTFIAVYPFIERWVTGDTGEHHLLNRPRNVPVRTGIGVAWILVYLVLWAAGGNDIIANTFSLSVNSLTWFFRIAFFVAPVLGFIITKRICIGLQRKDLELLHHGVETGMIVRQPSGAYTEAARPGTPDLRLTLEASQPATPEALPPATGDGEVERRRQVAVRLRASAQRWYTQDNVAREGDGHANGAAEDTEEHVDVEHSGRLLEAHRDTATSDRPE